MGKIKEFTKQVEQHLFDIYKAIGIDKPENHDAILEFVADDVLETADPLNWHSGDVAIAFRRWIESQGNVQDDNDYFKIVHKGYQKDLEREEIQVHGGENANIILIKTEEGFIVDVYDVNGEIVDSMTIWEDDITPFDEDE